MKRQMMLIMISIMLFLTGCGSKNETKNDSSTQDIESQESSETVNVLLANIPIREDSRNFRKNR